MNLVLFSEKLARHVSFEGAAVIAYFVTSPLEGASGNRSHWHKSQLREAAMSGAEAQGGTLQPSHGAIVPIGAPIRAASGASSSSGECVQVPRARLQAVVDSIRRAETAARQASTIATSASAAFAAEATALASAASAIEATLLGPRLF